MIDVVETDATNENSDLDSGMLNIIRAGKDILAPDIWKAIEDNSRALMEPDIHYTLTHTSSEWSEKSPCHHMQTY